MTIKLIRFVLRESRSLSDAFLSLRFPQRLPYRFKRNIRWLKKNTNPAEGIRVNSRIPLNYPEVTGYLVPSLIQWGENDLADQYVSYLLPAQDVTGGFRDPSGNQLCLFDTGQVVRGLLAHHDRSEANETEIAIKKSIQWVDSLISEDGTILIPEVGIWGGVVPEAISLYALEPMLRAARKFELNDCVQRIELAISKFLLQPEIIEHKTLNHFHAYVIEALVDLGKIELAEEAMKVVTQNIRRNGSLPAHPDSKWSCSTGQFQYAVIYFKLGQKKFGDQVMNYALRHQNFSGGWYGTCERAWSIRASFGRIYKPWETYFATSEIPWANKYFMDALHWRLILSFEEQSEFFSNKISSSDGRVRILLEEIAKLRPNNLLDAGSGKGRYLEHIQSNFPEVKLFASDISTKVMAGINPQVKKIQGTLTKIPFPSNTFDFVVVIEALEHSVNVSGALLEVNRVLKPGGTALLIDKNAWFLGRLQLPPWEQWFFPRLLKAKLKRAGFVVQVVNGVPFENTKSRMFTAWIAKKL